jgi:hypothetical protein
MARFYTPGTRDTNPTTLQENKEVTPFQPSDFIRTEIGTHA